MKNLGYILAAAILIAGLFLWSEIEASHEREDAGYLSKIDSLTTGNARLTIAVDTLMKVYTKRNAKADSIASTNVTTIILNNALEATRNATVDSVGAILDRRPE